MGSCSPTLNAKNALRMGHPAPRKRSENRDKGPEKMNEMVVVKKVVLNERHLRPGRTKHTIHDKNGPRDYPPFVSLFITSESGIAEVIMWRRCANGEAAHTHHDTLDDALDQAEFEFEVMRNEWVDASEAFRSLKEYTREGVSDL
jgi:hypothetical protein